jgi:hypothetical protein
MGLRVDLQPTSPTDIAERHQQFSEILDPILGTLHSDGYLTNIDVDESSHLVTVAIEATPDACRECLVPEPVLQEILTDALGVAETIDATSWSLRITMPTASA